MKKFFYFIVVVLFIGCGLKQESIDINSYSIDFNSKNKISKSIFIEEPVVNKIFNSKAIFYSPKPYLFEEYGKNRWINLPSSMIQNSLFESFKSSNTYPSKEQYDYVLKTNILKLYHEINADKSYMVLKVNFDLLKEEKLVKSFAYEKKVEVLEKNPYGFVKVVNKTFIEIIDDLTKEIILL